MSDQERLRLASPADAGVRSHKARRFEKMQRSESPQQSARGKVKALLFGDGFLARPASASRHILGPSFLKKLFALRPDQHWVNVGTGLLPELEKAYVDGGGKAKVTGIGTERRTNAHRELSQAGLFEYLGGRLIERYKPGQIATADLVTDQYGALTYTAKLHTVLRAELALLKQGGELVGHFDENTRIVDRNGNDVTLQWLKSIKGIDVVGFDTSRTMVKGLPRKDWPTSHRFVLKRTGEPLRVTHLATLVYGEHDSHREGSDLAVRPPRRLCVWEGYDAKTNRVRAKGTRSPALEKLVAEWGKPPVVSSDSDPDKMELVTGYAMSPEQEAIKLFREGNASAHQNTRAGNEKALRSYRKALKLYSASPVGEFVWTNMGSTYAQRGETAKAIDAYDRALAVNPDYSRALLSKGRLLAEQGKTANALEVIDRALLKYPDDPNFNYDRGSTLSDLGRNGEALNAFVHTLAKVSTTDPIHGYALLGKGVTLARLAASAPSKSQSLPMLKDAIAAVKDVTRLESVKAEPELLAAAKKQLGLIEARLRQVETAPPALP